MKKFACLVLALAMVFSLGISAGAVSPIQALDGTDSKTVTVTVEASAVSTVYYVEVKWTDMEFTYSFDEKTWDPTNHSYTETTGAWKDVEAGKQPTADITVVNHSNAAVNASIKFESGSTRATLMQGVTAEIENYSLALPTAENTTFAQAPSRVATVKIQGTPEVRVSDVKSAKVIVAITAA